MSIGSVPAPAGREPLGTAVAALTVTQLIGWGTTFHIPAVLSERVAAGTGLTAGLVFGGITLMLLVAAALAPTAGRLLERYGGGRPMVAGSVLVAAGLGLLSIATGPAGFALAWAVLGLAMPFALNQASSTALVQISPTRARRAIALLLMLSGFSGTFAWPALLWLDASYGWRIAVAACAGANLLVCAPLHALLLPRHRPLVALATGSSDPPTIPAPARPVRGALALAAVTFSLSGMLTWGLPLHMLGILRDFGHAELTAVWIGSLFGPGQVLARGFEMLGGHRVGILHVGVLAMGLMPLALLPLLLWGEWRAGAIAFTVGYGLSAGLTSVVRAVAPLRLFGAAAYATVLGRLSVPQNIAFATAPLGFAAVRDLWGSTVLVGLALLVGIACLAGMLVLERRARAVGVR